MITPLILYIYYTYCSRSIKLMNATSHPRLMIVHLACVVFFTNGMKSFFSQLVGYFHEIAKFTYRKDSHTYQNKVVIYEKDHVVLQKHEISFITTKLNRKKQNICNLRSFLSISSHFRTSFTYFLWKALIFSLSWGEKGTFSVQSCK